MSLVIGMVPGTAATGPKTEDLRLQQLWVIDSEETLIGSVAQVLVRGDRTYVLDDWLEKVLVISNAGEIVSSFGQTGDGPGEYRYPMGLLALGDGRIGVVSRIQPKLAVFGSDGEAIESVRLGPSPEQIWGVASAGDTIVVRSVQRFTSDEKRAKVHRLRRCAFGDVAPLTYVETTLPEPPRGYWPVAETLPARVWALGGDGHVYVSPAWDAYRIQVFASDGTELAPMTRPYDHVPLAEDKYEERKRSYREAGERIGISVTPSRHYSDIHVIIARADGTLWVQPSDGRSDPEHGVFAAFDVFDAKGTYTRRVRLLGRPYDPEVDQYFIAADRLFVVERGLEAGRGRFSGSSKADAPEADAEDPVALRIVCYALPLEPAAR